jgi:hypothetical protein
MFPGVVDKNAPHRLRGNSVEVPAVLPRDAVVPGESQEDLVNERRRLQGVVRAFVAEVPGRAFAQLVIYERDKLVARTLIPARPCMQELADRANAVAHATAFGLPSSIHDFDVLYFRPRRTQALFSVFDLHQAQSNSVIGATTDPNARILTKRIAIGPDNTGCIGSGIFGRV